MMKKSILAFFLTIVLVLSLFPVSSFASESGSIGNLTWNFNSNTGVLRISGSGEMPDYTFFERGPWSSLSSSITSIVVEEGVTYIGDYAFCLCKEATSISLPSTIESIGGYAFDSCSKLITLNIPEGVESLADFALSGIDSLTDITVDSENKYFKSIDGVLYDIDAKTIICYPMCYAGDSYVIPDYVTTIGKGAFSCAENLKTVTIPNTVTLIDENAFFVCSKLESIIIPPSVTKIGAKAFTYCGKLSDLTILNGVTEIGSCAFECCRSLTSVVIPDSVTVIYGSAFSDCSELTSVTIGKSVRNIVDSAFYECTKINKVVFTGTSEVWNNLISFNQQNTCLTNASRSYGSHNTHDYHYYYDFNEKCETNGTITGYCTCDSATESVEKPNTALEHQYSDWKVIQEPTPTVDGLKRKTCSLCAKNVDEILSYAEASQSVVKNARYFAAITLNDSIDINFEMTGFTAGFDIGKLVVRVDSQPIELTLTDNSVNGILASKCATQIGDSISCVVSYDSIEVKSFEYSVRKYCVSTLEDETPGLEKTQELCKAVLNYGAYAQLAFDYKTDDLANKDYEIDINKISIPTADPVEYVSSGAISEIRISMVLKSSVAINFKFTSTVKLTVDDFTVKNQRGEKFITSNLSVTDLGDGVYQLTLKNISANKLSSLYTVSVKGIEIKYGAYTYCYNAQGKTENDGFTTADKNLCKAIYNYGKAADDFRNA